MASVLNFREIALLVLISEYQQENGIYPQYRELFVSRTEGIFNEWLDREGVSEVHSIPFSGVNQLSSDMRTLQLAGFVQPKTTAITSQGFLFLEELAENAESWRQWPDEITVVQNTALWNTAVYKK
jgi:hypothetical protein